MKFWGHLCASSELDRSPSFALFSPNGSRLTPRYFDACDEGEKLTSPLLFEEGERYDSSAIDLWLEYFVVQYYP